MAKKKIKKRKAKKNTKDLAKKVYTDEEKAGLAEHQERAKKANVKHGYYSVGSAHMRWYIKQLLRENQALKEYIIEQFQQGGSKIYLHKDCSNPKQKFLHQRGSCCNDNGY